MRNTFNDYILSNSEVVFYKEIKRMLLSRDRRSDYIPLDTPVCEVNWSSHFDELDPIITVSHLEDLLDAYETEKGDVKL